jgi:hypothetical protein
MKRREKKSETIEIRLPYSQKQAFMEACREQGVTASDTLRRLIAQELEAASPPEKARRTFTMTIKDNPLKAAAGAAGAALTAALFGGGVSMAEDQVFSSYDRNADGVITYGEFAGLTQPRAPAGSFGHERIFEVMDQDGSQSLGPREFEGEGAFTRRTDQVTERDGVRARVIGIERFAYDVAGEEETAISVTSATKTVDVDASPEEIEAAYAELAREMQDGR